MSKSQKIRQQERQRVLAEIGQKTLQAEQHGQSHIITASQFQAEFYSGPLPNPDMLREYEDVLPGLAEKIVSQFEEQGRHRRWLERTNMTHATGRSWTGLLCGLSVAIFGLWVAKELGGASGAILGGIDLVSLV